MGQKKAMGGQRKGFIEVAKKEKTEVSMEGEKEADMETWPGEN